MAVGPGRDAPRGGLRDRGMALDRMLAKSAAATAVEYSEAPAWNPTRTCSEFSDYALCGPGSIRELN